MHALDIIGYAGAALMIATLSMKTMVPLRTVGIISSLLSGLFGLLNGIYPMLIQHSILLPINSWRLFQMLRLIRQVKAANAGDLNMDWLKPFMNERSVEAGEVLFRKGDEANAMFFVITGKLRLREIGIDVPPGAIVGELGLLQPEGKRTQTLECVERTEILQISYDRVEQLYFQNPKFGIYFLRLTSARLFDNIDRLENALAAREAEIADLRAARVPAD